MRHTPTTVITVIAMGIVSNCIERGPVEERELDLATIVLALENRFGELRRAPVEFNHAAHVKAVDTDGCEACHKKAGTFSIPRAAGAQDRDEAMNAYHDTCIPCHRGAQKGPVLCGECHVLGRTWKQPKRTEVFTDKLHDQHMAALDDQCGKCHHVYDEAQKQLVYKAGEEAACNTCHKAAATDNAPSLLEAIHSSCVACHLERNKNNQRTGNKIRCIECH